MITVEKDAGPASKERYRARARRGSGRKASVLCRDVLIRVRLLRARDPRVSVHSRVSVRRDRDPRASIHKGSGLSRAAHREDALKADARRASVRGTDKFR